MNTEAPYLAWETRGHARVPLQETTTLGRLPDNALCLEDAGCSGRHAIIRRQEGRWLLEDLGSTNGTWVNGQRIEQPHVLKEGDRIQMGGQTLCARGLAACCRNCGRELPEGAAFCPGCGCNQAAPPPPPTMAPASPPAIHPPAPPATPVPGQGTQRGSRVLFWILFTLLAAFDLLLALAGRGLLFYALIFLSLAGLLILKRVLSKGVLRPILAIGAAWAVAVVAFVAAGTGQRALTEEADTSGTITQQNGEVSVVLPAWTLPEGARLDIQKSSSPSASPEDPGVIFQAYDISLPPGTSLDGIAEIQLPFDRGLLPPGAPAEDAVGAAYFDPQRSAWAPIPCSVDAEKALVSIYTDHFSRYAAVILKDGRKKLGEALPRFDSAPIHFFSPEDDGKILAEMASGAAESPTALEKGWGQFNKLYGLTGASSTLLETVAGSETLTHVNKLMNEAGMGFALAQLAFDLSKLDNQAAAQNFSKSSAYYALSKWGGDALGLASAGVTFMDLALNEFGEAALDKNQQKWNDAYRRYYEPGGNARRSAGDWYALIAKLHKEARTSGEFKTKLDQAMTEHCQRFWTDPEGYAHVAESTPGLRGFGAGGETAAGPKKISGNYKAYLYRTTVRTALNRYIQKLWFLETMKAENAFNAIKAELNRVYTVTVQLQTPGAVKNLQAASVRFLTPLGQVVHGQSFDAGGQCRLSMSLFGFLKTGGPNTVEVTVPAQDGTPAFSTRLTYQLLFPERVILIPYAPAPKENKPDPRKPEPPKNTAKPMPPPAQPAAPVPPPAPTKTYDYEAAFAKWVADYKAQANRTRRDETWGQDHVYTLEFTSGPRLVKDGPSPGIYGAHQIWDAWTFYTGDRKGQSGRSTVNSFAMDTPGGGLYISLGELRGRYPQFLK